MKADSVSALNCIAKPKSTAVWACLAVNSLDMPGPFMGRVKENTQITHYALSLCHQFIICTSCKFLFIFSYVSGVKLNNPSSSQLKDRPHYSFRCRPNIKQHSTTRVGGGGKGVTSAWSPLGNFLEGQAHPNLHQTRFCYFFDVKFFVFAFRWFFTEVVMFIFGWFSV